MQTGGPAGTLVCPASPLRALVGAGPSLPQVPWWRRWQVLLLGVWCATLFAGLVLGFLAGWLARGRFGKPAQPEGTEEAEKAPSGGVIA